MGAQVTPADSVTLGWGLVLTLSSSLITIGGAWAVMRTRVNDQKEALKQQDADLREVFRRLAALERDVVTRENLAEFRKEIIGEIHGLRDLIERIRPRARPSSSE